MSFYGDMAETAVEMLAEFGRPVTLRSKGAGSFDPIANTFTAGESTDRAAKAVFTEYKAKDIDGTVILRGDKMAMIADLTTPPDTSDVLIDGADQYAIVNVQTIQPGDTPILYKLQVRR